MDGWRAGLWCGGTGVLVVALVVSPSVLADHTPGIGSTLEPLVTGVYGAVLAVVAFTTLPSLIGVSPRMLLLDAPTLAVVRWTGLAASIAGILSISTILLTEGSLVLVDDTASRLLLGLLTAIAIGLWTGIVEELFLRGVVLSVLGHRWNWLGAAVVTALLFGLLHSGHGTTAGATFSYVVLTTIAGFCFALVVIVTGRVWNAIALHGGWNTVFSDHLLSFTASDDVTPLLLYRPIDPHWIFEPEGGHVPESPLAIGLFLIMAAGLIVWAERRTRHPDS